MSAEPEGTEKENTEPDNTNVGLIATVTVVGALLVVAIAVALNALVRSEATRHGNEVGAFANLGEVTRLKETQSGKLSELKWEDRAKGLVALPIDRAQEVVLADIRKNPNLATPYPPEEEKDEPDAGAADAGAEKTPAAAGEKSPGKGGDAVQGAAPGGQQAGQGEPQKPVGATPGDVAPQQQAPAPAPAPGGQPKE